ncbi:MAG: hypothetical protein ABIV51_03480 [Saprospiraceae bacterium]
MNFWEFSFGWDSGPNWIQDWIALGLVYCCSIILCLSIINVKKHFGHKAISFLKRIASICALLLGIDLIKTLLILRYMHIEIPFHNSIDTVSFYLYAIGMIVLPFQLTISNLRHYKGLQYLFVLTPILTFFALRLLR